jgi:hypothetical protein
LNQKSLHRQSEALEFSKMSGRALDKVASGWRRLSGAFPRLLYKFYVDENQDYNASILLAGSGRAGTTWVAEIINFDNSYRLMFEPFNNARVPQTRFFGDCQYLRPDENNPIFLAPARSIFSGRLRNGWVDAYNRRLRVDRRLVKDIRANLLLGWIRAHFPEIPIVLLLRHPCAVAYSRCALKWSADLENTFIRQEALMNDYLQPFLPALQEARSDFERHVFWWCIEAYVPLMQFSRGDILVTTYEDCVASPETEVRRIFDYLRKPFNDEVLKAIGKPSSQTRWNWRSRNASAIVSGEGIVNSWQRSVSRGDAERAIEILHLFGLDSIYGLDRLPNSPSIEKFMRGGRARGLTLQQDRANPQPFGT